MKIFDLGALFRDEALIGHLYWNAIARETFSLS